MTSYRSLSKEKNIAHNTTRSRLNYRRARETRTATPRSSTIDPSRPRSTTPGRLSAIVDRMIVKVHAERNKERWKRSGASGRDAASPFRRMKVIGESQLAPLSSRARERASGASARTAALARRTAPTALARSCASHERAHTEKISALAAPLRAAQLRGFT